MRDRRDYVIAALAAALLFCLGIFVGNGASFLSDAVAQDATGAGGSQGGGDDGSFSPTDPLGQHAQPDPTQPSGLRLGNTTPNIRPGFGNNPTASLASDSNSNNRFVAVTAPVGSGESVLFLIDSKNDQVVVYRYLRRKGLQFLAGRKIDYDLRIKGYQDQSDFSRDEMKRLFEKHRAREAAKAVKNNK